MNEAIRSERIDLAHGAIAYREAGPRDGPVALLVHGFPDDARTWDRLATALAADGRRAIAPFLRGYGPTTLAQGVARTGEIAALARDLLALADALGLARFDLVGHDWGARAGYAVATFAPERLRALVTLAVPYGTGHRGDRLAFDQVRSYWYQWYFATSLGEAELQQNRAPFCRGLWRVWSPGWEPEPGEYEATAASFDNPDFVPVVLSSYRVRWGLAAGDPALAADREALEPVAPLAVPTLTLLGADDRATLAASGAGSEARFSGPYALDVLAGCGHFVQRERPDQVAKRVLAHLRAYESA